jgi:putative aldouronate transport system substrate-binding protein
MEPFFDQVMDQRTAQYGDLDEPLVGGIGLEMPYWFALESFLNDSFLAVCNIDGIDDIAGYDSNTVFNLYATPEYKAACESMQRMVDKNILAYDYTTSGDTWNASGNMFAWPGWGYTYMQQNLFSDTFTTKMVDPSRVWTDTNNYFSAGTALSAHSANPEREMMFLNLVNTDPKLATMLRFGIEGTHYTYDANGNMTFDGTRNADPANRGYYYWYGAPIGNLLIVQAPEDLTGPDGVMLTKMAQYNQDAKTASHMGFVFNIDPVSNEVAACTNVVMQYRDTLRNGTLNSTEEVDSTIDEFNAKLMANGEQKILDEVTAQIAAWQAANAQ